MDHGSKSRRRHHKGPHAHEAREARHPTPSARGGAWGMLFGIALFAVLIVLFMH